MFALLHLLPNQLRVCVKGGCEAIIHAVSTHLSSYSTDCCWTLLLDFCNAFNSIAMFHEFHKHISSLSSWIEASLDGQLFLAQLLHNKGIPYGHLGFALTLHLIIERIQAKVPNLDLNIWYLDYGTLIGSLNNSWLLSKSSNRMDPILVSI